MIARSTVVFAAVLLLAACALTTSEITHKKWEKTSRLSTGETVVVIGERDFGECVSNKLKKASPTTRIFSNEEFRRQLYPWFEPATAPRNEEDFQSLLRKPLVSEKLGELGVRYAVIVRGSTHKETTPYGEVDLALVDGDKMDTSMRASVWDLKSAELAGNLQASASGTVYLFSPHATETMACSDIASELAEFLGGEPSQGK